MFVSSRPDSIVMSAARPSLTDGPSFKIISVERGGS